MTYKRICTINGYSIFWSPKSLNVEAGLPGEQVGNLYNDGYIGKADSRDEAILMARTYMENHPPRFQGEEMCFIATAAYSTSIHPDLDTFRSFRDKKLLPNPFGKRLVSIYYKVSPSIARYIDQQPTIKKPLKYHLSHLANWMRK